MDELELLFEDEAKVYLPKVVANENERKSNELERIANEEKRVANEKERVENEEKRKVAMEQFDSMKDELIASVEKISFSKEYKTTYTTTTENEYSFKLPSEYTQTSTVWVYVNGMKLNADEYIIDTENSLVMLTKPLDVIGTTVELAVYRLTTAVEEDIESLRGEDGVGLPTGGTTGQVLVKKSDTDYDFEWTEQTGGGGGVSDYNDLINKPTIPAKTSELENDSNFITNDAIPTKISDLENDSNFVTGSDIPAKTSDLENDSNFETKDYDNTESGLVSTEIKPAITELAGLIGGLDCETGTWTPIFTCMTPSDAPTVTYSQQTGEYIKIPLKGTTYSLVYLHFYIKGVIKEIKGDNYAAIGGLPYTPATSSTEGFTFTTFANGIDTTHAIPVGLLAGGQIRVRNATAGVGRGGAEKWITHTANCTVVGSGFYLTKQ